MIEDSEIQERLREMDNLINGLIQVSTDATETQGFILQVLQTHHMMLGQIMRALEMKSELPDMPDITPTKKEPIQ